MIPEQTGQVERDFQATQERVDKFEIEELKLSKDSWKISLNLIGQSIEKMKKARENKNTGWQKQKEKIEKQLRDINDQISEAEKGKKAEVGVGRQKTELLGRLETQLKTREEAAEGLSFLPEFKESIKDDFAIVEELIDAATNLSDSKVTGDWLTQLEEKSNKGLTRIDEKISKANKKVDNAYKILELPKNITSDNAVKEYRKLSMQFHPDRNPGDNEALAKYTDINDAWGILDAKFKAEKKS